MKELRSFSEPKIKLPIPDDFPDVVSGLWDVEELEPVIKAQLALCDADVNRISHINIAYPHKHDDQKIRPIAERVREELARIMPNIDWVLADCIYETKDLNRGENQSLPHMLKNSPKFAVDPNLQQLDLPFLYDNSDKPEYFIMVDDRMASGTTFSSLMSYLHHNGGTVLAAYALECTKQNSLTQQSKKNWINKIFGGEEVMRKDEIAVALGQNASRNNLDIRPEAAISLLEEWLDGYGNSLESLTDREAERMASALESNIFSLNDIIIEPA